MKRLLDLVAAVIALIVLSPILALISVAIKLDSQGGVFFRQKRVGRQGLPFEMLKFRSMVQGADRIGPYFTSDGDPRITRLGKFLRRTSLDELPQILNVLRGDMSLVGPRPDVPEQESLYTQEEWKTRNTVRPGLTGPAQAELRSKATLEQRKKLDLDYAKNPTLAKDARIVLATLRQVLLKGGN